MTEKEFKRNLGVVKVVDNKKIEQDKEKMRREKKAAYMREYYKKNRDKILARKNATRNIKKELEQQRKRYENDEEYKERKRQHAKKWREQNREKYNKYQREYRKKR